MQNNIPLHLIFENNHCLIAFSKPRVNKHMKAKLNTENLATIILLINFNKLKLGTLWFQRKLDTRVEKYSTCVVPQWIRSSKWWMNWSAINDLLLPGGWKHCVALRFGWQFYIWYWYCLIIIWPCTSHMFDHNACTIWYTHLINPFSAERWDVVRN